MRERETKKAKRILAGMVAARLQNLLISETEKSSWTVAK